ncbi:MAG: TonB-dependent receptor, partial [Solimonas sp.]
MPAAAESTAAAEPETLPTIALPPEKPAPVKVDRTVDDAMMGEVIVTAQKREERLQDVPLAVTVVSKKQLEQQNISTTGDLTRAAPAVELYGEPGNPETRFSIRGISTNSFSATAEQAVSFVADGVVLGRAPAVSLFDVAQVEVLRGPQGTLFGKNSSAGVISITTNKPDPSQFEAKLHADLGNEYDYRLLQGMVNIPVGDTAALRVSAGQTYQSGFIHNNVTGQDSESNIKGGRARFLWDITPDLRVNIIADYEKSYVSEQLYLLFDRYVDEDTGEPKEIPGCDAYANESMRITCNSHPTNNTNEIWGFSGQIDWTVGEHTITSISSARRYMQNGTIDVDGMPGMYYDNGNKFDNKVYSQELRIASPSGDWIEYVAGVYGSKAHVPNYLQQNIGDDMLASILAGTLPVTLCSTFQVCFNGRLAQLQNPNEYIADLRSIAAFGQATMRFFDDWRFIMGARETRDQVEMTSTSFLGVQLLGQSVIPALLPLNEPLKGEDTVNNFSWKLGLQYDVTPVSMAYFTASRGYKGPQVVFNPPGIIPTLDGLRINPPAKASISIVKPEFPMDYELGFKTLLWGGFYANLNLFHTTIKDYQSSVFNAQGTFTPNNIDSVTTQGVELDFFGAPFKGFTISGGFMWNKVE